MKLFHLHFLLSVNGIWHRGGNDNSWELDMNKAQVSLHICSFMNLSGLMLRSNAVAREQAITFTLTVVEGLAKNWEPDNNFLLQQKMARTTLFGQTLHADS